MSEAPLTNRLSQRSAQKPFVLMNKTDKTSAGPAHLRPPCGGRSLTPFKYLDFHSIILKLILCNVTLYSTRPCVFFLQYSNSQNTSHPKRDKNITIILARAAKEKNLSKSQQAILFCSEGGRWQRPSPPRGGSGHGQRPSLL